MPPSMKLLPCVLFTFFFFLVGMRTVYRSLNYNLKWWANQIAIQTSELKLRNHQSPLRISDDSTNERAEHIDENWLVVTVKELRNRSTFHSIYVRTKVIVTARYCWQLVGALSVSDCLLVGYLFLGVCVWGLDAPVGTLVVNWCCCLDLSLLSIILFALRWVKSVWVCVFIYF